MSMVLDPAGNIVGEPLSESEGIVYAEIDTARSVEPKQFHDVTGYYNRFDIFDLRIDRSGREPAQFIEGQDKPRAAVGSAGPLDSATAIAFPEGVSAPRER
jgi:aliphatic nitrilase